LKSKRLLRHVFTTFSILSLRLIGLSQEQSKLDKIDSMVYSINNTRFTETTDTAVNNIPAYNIFISTIQTTISEDINLKKHIHHILNFGDSQKKIKTGDYFSIYYYNKNTLIKVEESADDKNGSFKIFWYFEDNKVIKIQMQPTPVDKEGYEKIKEREPLLRKFSESFLFEFRLKHPST